MRLIFKSVAVLVVLALLLDAMAISVTFGLVWSATTDVPSVTFVFC